MGDEKTIRTSATPLRDAQGAFTAAVLLVADLTEEKQYEESLRREHDFIRAVLDTVASLVVVLDAQGSIVRVNRACELATGYSAAELIGQPVFDLLVPAGDLPGVRETFRQLRGGQFPNRHENRWRMKDGSERTFEWANTALTDEGGDVMFVIATGVDVTDRKRLETNQALLAGIADDFARLATEQEITRAIGARLAAHLDITTCSIADFAGGMAAVRSAFTRPGAVEPATTTLKVSDFLDELRAAASAGQTIVIRDMRTDPRVDADRYEALGVRSGIIVPFLVGGEWRHSFAVGAPNPRDWRDDELLLVEEVATRFFPRIERARAEEALARAHEQLTEADRRKTEFLGVLSHELRNPLAPIRSSIYLLERAPSASAQAAHAREVIRRQTEHLTRLVDDLLDVTRISRGKVQLRREVLDLRNVVRRTCEDHRILFEDAEIELNLDFPAAPVWADVDPTRIAQVVGNLLNNANKFTPPYGSVTVRLRGRGGHAEITVRDTGTGIDAEQLARMFQPFAQEDRSLARTRGGLGLGLALSKGLVELHHGAIAASSAGPGEGAEFTVTLPLADPDERLAGAPGDEGRERTGESS